MDYSALVASIKNGDQHTANKLCAEATPILKKYVVSRTGCSSADADDAVQKMFEYIIHKILDDEIENPKGLLSYMLKTSKHMYFKMVKKQRLEKTYNIAQEDSQRPNQLWNLIDKEKQQILQECIDQLREGYREFITHWFSFPGANTEDIADHFDISVNNAWTRKHRIVKKLHDCVESHN